jgi:hypothetical protein
LATRPFYAFELPLNGIVQLLFGVGNLAAHIGSALTYLIVAGCAVTLAVTGSRGPARAVRCAVVIAVLAAPLQSGGRVQIRAVDLYRNIDGHPGLGIYVPGWESNDLWYNASWYDATFAVADSHGSYPAAGFEHFLGKPAATFRVASWLVLVYRANLLQRILPRPGPH